MPDELEAAVSLSPVEWQQVMAIISTAPWRDANPLLMKIGQQLQMQQKQQAPIKQQGIRLDANGREIGP
jgi:hypothetical protein